jgi:acyl-CoA reductase-like NAD-dependent aldehyde dehydrogenase
MNSLASSAIIPAPVRNWLEKLSAGEMGSANVISSNEEYFEVLDPGNGSRLASLPVTSGADVNQAVARARKSFESGTWRFASPDHRELVLLRLAELVERDFQTLSTIEALDTGKPLEEAKFDIQEVVTVLRYYAGWANKVSGQTIATPVELSAMTWRGPVGVCAAITPWNYPLPILMYKLAPALAFGNSFVAKPSELAPLSAIYFARLCEEAGVPEGVVSIVLGAGATGAELVSNPDLDKIAFTGSSKTGSAIMAAAAKNTTKVSLELGGKSPQVVFESADIARSVEGVARGIWTNAGQVCVAGSRLIVHRAIKDDFLLELSRFTDAYFVGHSLDSRSTMGPIISKPQQQKIEAIVDGATREGGNVLTLAKQIDLPGYYQRPTIIDSLPHNHSVHQEEIFGPVLTVSSFESEDEAIALANSTRYGLAAGVWTGRAGQAHRVARRITAGTVWINTYGTFHPTLPFGGTKSSGFGRELGESAVDAYTELKTVVEDISRLED